MGEQELASNRFEETDDCLVDSVVSWLFVQSGSRKVIQVYCCVDCKEASCVNLFLYTGISTFLYVIN